MDRSDIIGHKAQITLLENDVKNGNVSHAYLFAGSPFVGKTTVARWFAEELMTQGMEREQKGETIRQMEKLIQPDFLILDQLWIEEQCDDFDVIAQSTNLPQQHRAKPPTAKTDTIGIDDVREIQERVNETGNGPWRVCIIRGIERMQEAAANSFLKTLEEPPPRRVFLLTTDSLSSVIPTILSRTRVLHFERVAERDIRSQLSGLDDDDAAFVLHLAQGAPGMAMRLAADPDLRRAEKILHTQAVSFWGARTLIERLHILVPLTERGPDADRFLVHLALALRETPQEKHVQERALMELIRGLETNANRHLLVQRFAMSL